MPLTLTTQEKLTVLRNRRQQLRLNWAELELNVELYQNGDKPDQDAVDAVRQMQGQVEASLAYVGAQIEALEEVEMGDLVDASRNGSKSKGRRG